VRPDVFLCGGGAHNGALVTALRKHLPGSRVAATDTLGVAGDWVEAMAFAWLARQRLLERSGNCPLVTGATRPAVLGGLWLPG
jgi:anhydro-N-acetylmuramic acid kinase